MPQYKDHAEASQDNDDEFGMADDGQDSMTGFNDDGQELLSGQVHDSQDSFEALDDTAEVSDDKNLVKMTPEASPASEVKKPSHPHPNMEVFWETKTFADVKIICGGGVVTAHRLILAAKNDLFYQVLIDCSDEEFSVILMPDHSVQDVTDMIKGFYDFKTSTNAFPFNSDKVEVKDDPEDETEQNDDLSHPLPNKLAKMHNILQRTNEKKPFSPFPGSVVDISEDHDAGGGEVSNLRTSANNNTLDRLIMKGGSSLCPTYSCKVPGCQFSVQSSLMCIKGHILTEHWGNLG